MSAYKQFYNKMKDEVLVALYNEKGEEEAFNELFKRYEKLLRKQAEHSASRTNVDRHALHHKYVYQFWRAVQNYDPSRGASFKTFLWHKLSTVLYDVLKSEKYRSVTDENGQRLLKEQPIADEVLDKIAVEEVLDDELIVEDIIKHLESKDYIYATVLRLMLAGFTYEEIAAKLQRHGSPAAVRNWVKRLKQKIAKYVTEYYELAGVKPF